MYVKPLRLGCCSSGPAGPGFGDPLPGTSAAVAALSPPPDGTYWGTLFAISIAAGVTLHFLTGRGKR